MCQGCGHRSAGLLASRTSQRVRYPAPGHASSLGAQDSVPGLGSRPRAPVHVAGLLSVGVGLSFSGTSVSMVTRRLKHALGPRGTSLCLSDCLIPLPFSKPRGCGVPRVTKGNTELRWVTRPPSAAPGRLLGQGFQLYPTEHRNGRRLYKQEVYGLVLSAGFSLQSL